VKPIVLVLSVLFLPVRAAALQHVVPSEYATIQGAIDAATAGDEVLVMPGTYPETLILKSGVSVVASAGPASTILSGGGVSGAVVQGTDVADLSLAGFTIASGGQRGGLRLTGYGAAGAVTITDCTFTGNADDTDAGGATLINGCTATFSDCTFSGNTGPLGGGLLVSGSGAVQVVDSTFLANASSGAGGAVHVVGGAVSLQGCSLTANSALLEGGAVAVELGTLEMTSCIVTSNSAVSGGGVAIQDFSSASIALSTIHDNSALSGGGLWFDDNLGSTLEVTRSVIAASADGGATHCDNYSVPTFTCVDSFDNAGGDALCGVDGGGNLSVDPQFCRVDPAGDGVYLLQADSPLLAINNACAVDIGATGAGCGVTAVEQSTWGAVKATYR